jgi:hypothetical protein
MVLNGTVVKMDVVREIVAEFSVLREFIKEKQEKYESGIQKKRNTAFFHIILIFSYYNNVIFLFRNEVVI